MIVFAIVFLGCMYYAAERAKFVKEFWAPLDMLLAAIAAAAITMAASCSLDLISLISTMWS